ncbi:ATP-binding cassette domain-containing protein [Prosthecochloris sp. N3]|uniref:ATP-binding cassette domain-containing protein n=1 Tax=Prosthecochloris ethylica TaxID=2743976 RepID=A0ABR9XSC5_9CHLB|nr:ATP-binding cassette domain-containing protein [Prosthecochloris ethylica]MBF0586686.1 ATP-binding cassette domain-containing protein [Prosthecochloris ethylica]MBF0636960.1 ATP-binding cassette domain-containing protein [Prosthecochloris ethylica]NUK47831.1 ATP-binding cassette domain-containing protein [Prosthecochloris ethylica]
MVPNVLRCNDLSKTFGSQVVLDSFSCTLHQGEVMGIVGPSGCGKTTILSMIAGLEQPSSGTVERVSPDLRIAYIFQESRLIPWFTVRENISFVLDGERLKGRVSEVIRDALHAVGLDRYADYYPDQLSGGMRQRVALARGLAYEPDVFLMDEPFSGLDFPLRMQMIDFLNTLLTETGISVMFVSHDTREITHLCDRVAVLHGSPGRLSRIMDLQPKDRRKGHPGYLQKMEDEMLQCMIEGAQAGTDKML